MPWSTRRGFLAASLGAAAAARFTGAAGSADLCALTLKQASDAVRAKKVSPVELTQACLDSIKTYNPKINAFITVMRERALAQAKELEAEQAAGKFRSPLHGIPIGIKDSIDTAGVRTTAASAVYENRTPSEDAEVVRRLKAAGAVIIGKCNMHEFDAGTSSAVSYWGPVRNPWNLEKAAGGASGGSAAAVAMGNCFAALGTDANGSIRIPAAYCGVTGLKPTYGRVSLRGIIPYSWSLDHCGPMTRTVEDAAMVLQQIAGYDALDIDCLDYAVPDYSAALTAKAAACRVGIPVGFFDHLDDEIGALIETAMGILNKLTRGSHEVALPSLLHAGAPGEVAAYHENVRGVNGGGYEPSTARAFPAAQDATRATDYIKGWREMELIRRTVNSEVFEKQGVEALAAPVVRHGVPTIEEELVAAPAGGGGGRGGRGGGATPTTPAAPAASADSRARSGEADDNTKPFNGYGLRRDQHPLRIYQRRNAGGSTTLCGPRFGECEPRWRWRTRMNRRLSGARAGPRSRPIPRFPHCLKPQPSRPAGKEATCPLTR